MKPTWQAEAVVRDVVKNFGFDPLGGLPRTRFSLNVVRVANDRSQVFF